MLYSSGTTGVPKGVAKPLGVTVPGHPEAPAVVIATGIGAMGVDDDSVYLSPAPLYHSAPLVYSMSMHRLGATTLVMESFDASACLAAIGRYRVTHAQFVPTMFTRLLRLPTEEREAADVSSLRYVVHAAAPCPVDVKRRMLEWWGPIIYEYYAGTEDIGSSFIGPAEWLAHPGSVGRPRDEMHIVGSRRRGGADRRDRNRLLLRRPGRSNTTTTPTRPLPSRTATAGGHSATWATSTRTATST